MNFGDSKEEKKTRKTKRGIDILLYILEQETSAEVMAADLVASAEVVLEAVDLEEVGNE